MVVCWTGSCEILRLLGFWTRQWLAASVHGFFELQPTFPGRRNVPFYRVPVVFVHVPGFFCILTGSVTTVADCDFHR